MITTRGQYVPHSAFATIREKIDDNHFVVLVKGISVEATYYRDSYLSDMVAGAQVFIERLPNSSLWMISSYGVPNPLASSARVSTGWFEIDHLVFGLVDGPARIIP